MSKGSITISLPKNTTDDEIKQIREQFNHKDYRLIILISGDESLKDNLKDFLKSELIS